MRCRNNSLHKPVVLDCWTDIGDILQDAAVLACKREAIKNPLAFHGWKDTHDPHLQDADLLLTVLNRPVQVELKKIKRRLTAYDIERLVIPRFKNDQSVRVLIHSSSLTTGAERLCRENHVKVFCVNYDIENHNAVLLLQQIFYDLTKLVIIIRKRAYVSAPKISMKETPTSVIYDTPPEPG